MLTNLRSGRIQAMQLLSWMTQIRQPRIQIICGDHQSGSRGHLRFKRRGLLPHFGRLRVLPRRGLRRRKSWTIVLNRYYYRHRYNNNNSSSSSLINNNWNVTGTSTRLPIPTYGLARCSILIHGYPVASKCSRLEDFDVWCWFAARLYLISTCHANVCVCKLSAEMFKLFNVILKTVLWITFTPHGPFTTLAYIGCLLCW